MYRKLCARNRKRRNNKIMLNCVSYDYKSGPFRARPAPLCPS